MIHSMILLMVLALGLGLGSVAVSWRYRVLYRLDFIKYLIIFLIALNTAAVIGIFFNYFGENLRGSFAEIVYRQVDIAYRLVTNFILLIVGGSLVLMLRALVGDTPSRTYLGSLAGAWGLVLVMFKASALTDQARRRLWVRRVLAVFGAVWVGLIAMSFLMFTDELGSRLFNLLSAVVYIVLNALPLVFLGQFLRHAYGLPPAASVPSARQADNLLDEAGVSGREREINQLVCRGYSNQQIADELYIFLATVKDHNHNIFRKLGVTSRTQPIARVTSAT